jgi:hypothetical protein
VAKYAPIRTTQSARALPVNGCHMSHRADKARLTPTPVSHVIGRVKDHRNS